MVVRVGWALCHISGRFTPRHPSTPSPFAITEPTRHGPTADHRRTSDGKRRELAKTLNTTPRTIQVWFHNQRGRLKEESVSVPVPVEAESSSQIHVFTNERVK
ncbi:hypothetical protein PROFUN_13382 [Planoprotostelium fungivorum]|uniref:Homeobox domain-containing protein n=1 Tax=Planoprotostelium fungivorum TaxID=1890364 RepID=A0A2P6MZT0_9EUKA|nr:hypothetical protein PROFUN_13382 [Planoprotostelium fungivorum]